MANEKVPLVTNPSVDVGELVAELIGDTGVVQQLMGGYRIRVFHSGAFPWENVFKELLFRDFKVFVTRRKAELIIEAQP